MMLRQNFLPSRSAALERLNGVDPSAYAKSRNFIDGAVTYLSPWLTHGFIDTREATKLVCEKHLLSFEDKLIFEFCWREFFKHAHAHLGPGILKDVRRPDFGANYAAILPADIREGRTGVKPIDEGIRLLYETGYIHNHVRMWIASYTVHLRKVAWRAGADWMYGHLLDGDLASNHLSWQWVAGTFSHKPYVFNAENVEKYAPAWACRGTVVDTDYPSLVDYAKSKTAFGPELNVSDHGLSEPTLLPLPRASTSKIIDLRNLNDLRRALEGLKGKSINLIHPWMLSESRLVKTANAINVGLLVVEFHEDFPWDERRWQFMLGGMKQLTEQIWLISEKQVGELASQTRKLDAKLYSTECFNPGYVDILETCSTELRPVPTILPKQKMFQRSFSRFYNKGCALADTLENALIDNEEELAFMETTWD